MAKSDQKPTGAEERGQAKPDQETAGVEQPREWKNILIRDDIYPDPAEVFAYKYPPVEQVKYECVYVLDTNVLLAPYQTMGHASLQNIQDIYRNLIKEKRLVVPAQVAREFAANRLAVISTLIGKLKDRQSELHEVKKEPYPLLDAMPEFKKFAEARDTVNKQMDQCRDAMGQLIARMEQWTYDDPVSEVYRKLFTAEVIREPDMKEDVVKELGERQDNGLPPGYKDKSKPDKGIGDFLIWKTLLRLAGEQKKSVVLVSNEIKPDWFHRTKNTRVFPRHELIEEFRRASGAQAFHIQDFAAFLKMLGAKDETVEQAKEAKESGSGIARLMGVYDRLLWDWMAARHSGNIRKGRRVVLSAAHELANGFRDLTVIDIGRLIRFSEDFGSVADQSIRKQMSHDAFWAKSDMLFREFKAFLDSLVGLSAGESDLPFFLNTFDCQTPRFA